MDNGLTMTLTKKDAFELPKGLIYLDGNSLGPLPRAVPERLASMVTDEWGQNLIQGWNVNDWMGQPMRVGNLIAQLIGAAEGSVTMGDTLSIKVYQALAAALEMRPQRHVILSDSGNFPSDLYMAEGLIRQLDRGHTLKIVDPADLIDAIDDTVAAVLVTEVDYKTGRLHDMRATSQAAHDVGAVMIWDLAHSAGALPVDLTASGCEFAVGCTYKYLNGGPGAPAFIYVRPDLIEEVSPALSGWLGHASPFAFEQAYRPASDIERMRVGTPPVMQMTALEAALTVWDDVDMHALRKASIELCNLFIELVEAQCSELTLASPRDGNKRGSQVSFHFEHGYAAVQALIAHSVIGDFRAPDIMRFGFTPLYIDEGDVRQAAERLGKVIEDRLWDDPKYLKQSRVT